MRFARIVLRRLNMLCVDDEGLYENRMLVDANMAVNQAPESEDAILRRAYK